jgi:hypothetical protein
MLFDVTACQFLGAWVNELIQQAASGARATVMRDFIFDSELPNTRL